MVTAVWTLSVHVPVHAAGTSFERRAISLRDGKTLWSQSSRLSIPILTRHSLWATLTADGPAEVVVRDRFGGDDRGDVSLTVLEGRDDPHDGPGAAGRDLPA